MRALAFAGLCVFCLGADASPKPAKTKAVGDSISYVFATDLGFGLYDLGGRSLQIYRYTYRRDLREVTPEQVGLRFVLSVTAGFFDSQSHRRDIEQGSTHARRQFQRGARVSNWTI